MGLVPDVAKHLSWAEVDHYLYGYERRHQLSLIGHRMTATRVHNMLPGENGTMTEAEFRRLPLVDAPLPAAPMPTKSAEEWLAELAAQNAKTLAARAASENV